MVCGFRGFRALAAVRRTKKEGVMKHFARMLALGLLGALFLVPALTPAVAQASWEFGLKAGVSAAKLSGDDTKYSYEVDADNYEKGEFTDMKLGFVGGAFATAHVNKQFGVRLEALYFQKGGEGTAEGKDGGVAFTADQTITLDYFEIPLLAVLSFPAGTSGTFDIFAGPAIAFNVTAKSKYEWTRGGESGTEEADLEDVKGTDFGGVLGVGFTLGMDSMNLFADARWEMGFTTIDDSEAEADIKNNAFAFMIGVGFPLGGSAQ
jgi:hypothetical protein